MTPRPLLIISDAPTAGTGLSRITRDLAVRIATNLPDVFRVATLGYGGPYSSKLPFHQYAIEMRDWVIFNLPEVWRDFAGNEKGILLTIWDPSRLLWLSRPENCADQRLRNFLLQKPFDLWGYLPIDATGPHNRLTAILRHTIEGFDRILAYSAWAAGVLERTLTANGTSNVHVDDLPHGIDTSVFQPRNRNVARHGFGERIGAKVPGKNGKPARFLTIPDDVFLVGIVATNQARKDWGLAIQTVAELAKYRNVMLWCHLDELERHFSIPALLTDFGLAENTVVTSLELSDEQMSYCLSACDVTLGIGNGEGWGLPLSESLACGAPVIHGNYGGATDFVPKQFLVEPIAYRLEGVYNCVRCVYKPEDWAAKVLEVAGTRTVCPEYIRWENAWTSWESWLRKGLEDGGHK
jgi:glycosyltransferase involved in cell wall biosynthesis